MLGRFALATGNICVITPSFGLWRSLVARPSGGRKVVGSNPASPTIFQNAGGNAGVFVCKGTGTG